MPRPLSHSAASDRPSRFGTTLPNPPPGRMSTPTPLAFSFGSGKQVQCGRGDVLDAADRGWSSGRVGNSVAGLLRRFPGGKVGPEGMVPAWADPSSRAVVANRDGGSSHQLRHQSAPAGKNGITGPGKREPDAGSRRACPAALSGAQISTAKRSPLFTDCTKAVMRRMTFSTSSKSPFRRCCACSGGAGK